MIGEIIEDKWHEECGIFGAFSHTADVANLTYLGLYALQHRGQESCGIALTNGAWMDVSRGMGLVNEVFRHQIPHMENQYIAIGHVRYSTTGSSLLANAQPMMVNYSGGKLAIAHNGNLTNMAELRHQMEETGSIFQTSNDTEVIVNLIARSRAETIEDKILESLKKLKGAFCLTIMTEDKLIAARDPQAFRPLCVGKTADAWVIASETVGLDVIGAEFVRDVTPGEMVVIDEDGLRSYPFATGQKLASCVFEHIYFARSDSIIDGQSVHQARFMMGRMLARETKEKFKGDIVIGVPDSGTSAATGYAYEAGIPFVEGLIKNRYVGRTFIQPEQKKREKSVLLKLNPIKSVVAGKDVIMIDDSIVRGTTSGKIVKMLRNAGARKIYMCASSPTIGYPCYYGIDTSVRKELIAATKTVEEIREYIGADGLHFLSLEGLKAAFENVDAEQMCYACFNNAYPVAMGEQPAGAAKYIFEHKDK